MPVSYIFSCKSPPHKLTPEELLKLKEENSNFLGVSYSDGFLLESFETLIDSDESLLEFDNLHNLTDLVRERAYKHIEEEAPWLSEEAKRLCKEKVNESLEPFLRSSQPLLATESFFLAAFDDGMIEMNIKKASSDSLS